MRKRTSVLTIFMIIVLAVSIGAEVKISGEARIRPRLDIKDNGPFGDKISNGYYYYLARMNFKSELGDGWFGHIQLGTNGYGYFTGKFADPVESNPSKPNSTSVDGASRGPVDFMLIYFGRKTERFGYMAGLMPFNGITNPMLDLHYYPDRMIDVPYYLFSNNGAYGFSGYLGLKELGRINASVIIDNNDGVKIEDTLSVTTEDIVDQYTLMLDAQLTFAEFVLQPVLLFTAIRQDSSAAPMTFGLNLTTPKVGKFIFGGSFGISSESKVDTASYDAWYARAKVSGKAGPGTLTAWYDLAEKTVELTGGDRVHNYGYLWLSYTIPIYKSENGKVTIKPTWRHITEKVETLGFDTKDFKRNKIEVAIDYTFN